MGLLSLPYPQVSSSLGPALKPHPSPLYSRRAEAFGPKGGDLLAQDPAGEQRGKEILLSWSWQSVSLPTDSCLLSLKLS